MANSIVKIKLDSKVSLVVIRLLAANVVRIGD
jgi:hypothetical protein